VDIFGGSGFGWGQIEELGSQLFNGTAHLAGVGGFSQGQQPALSVGFQDALST
jgi:hypothetical protein